VNVFLCESTSAFLFCFPFFIVLMQTRASRSRRECEQTISLQYLQQLNRAYELFLSDISPLVPIIKVHVDESTKKEVCVAFCLWACLLTDNPSPSPQELADFLAEEIRQLEQSNIRVLSLPPRK